MPRMPRFKYVSSYPVFYPALPVDGALAPISPQPGDVYVLDEAPEDGRWEVTEDEPTRVPDNEHAQVVTVVEPAPEPAPAPEPEPTPEPEAPRYYLFAFDAAPGQRNGADAPTWSVAPVVTPEGRTLYTTTAEPGAVNTADWPPYEGPTAPAPSAPTA